MRETNSPAPDDAPLPTRLREIIAEFADLEPRERLELLLEFANRLPALPPEYQARQAAGENRIHECMTPVWMWIEISDGRVRIHAASAEEAPTVKGFLSVLREALDGASPREVLAVPVTLLALLGLQQALGMTRMRGLQAILARLRQGVGDAARSSQPRNA